MAKSAQRSGSGKSESGKPGQPVKTLPRKSGETHQVTSDDPVLTTAANNTLARNGMVPAGVEASAKDGNVRLTGVVSYGHQRAAAETAVAALPGVRGIRNKVEVKYETEPADVTLLVHSALARYALVPDDSDVRAVTTRNTVTLTGHVRTATEHDAVIGASWMANGVYTVIDELQVTG